MRNMMVLLKITRVFFARAMPEDKRKRSRKSAGQSMVEFGLTLPILFLLFSGMVEFGFMINTYLSLQDAVRTAARRFSNENHMMVNEATGLAVDDLDFYRDAAQAVVDTLMPPDDSAARQIVVDETRDNVLISVVTIRVDETANPDAISSITRHPNDAEFFRLYDDTSPNSIYGDNEIAEYLTMNGAVPVDMGLLIIEIFYSYEGVLHLPWTEPFFSEANPAMLHNSTIVPLVSAKPTLTETAPP